MLSPGGILSVSYCVHSAADGLNGYTGQDIQRRKEKYDEGLKQNKCSCIMGKARGKGYLMWYTIPPRQL